MNRAIVHIIAFSFLLVSCSSPNVSVTATIVPPTPLSTEPLATATPFKTVIPHTTITTRPTRTTRPTPTATLESCPGLEKNVAAQLDTDFFPPLLNDIANYLEQGKPVTKIPTIFSKEPQVEGDLERVDVGAQVVDLTGDGSQDVVVTISNRVFIYGSSGAFVFRKCSTGGYTIHYMSTDPTNTYHFDFSDVRVIPVRLLTDNSTQLIVSYGNPLSGRCFAETYLVVGLEKGSWQTYLNDEVGCEARDITTVVNVRVSDKDDDGRNDITLEGPRWTGWGVYQFASRDVSVTYTWQADKLQLTESIFSPSHYRFHVLEDAERALEAGNVAQALADYQKAFLDESLADLSSWYEFETLHVNWNSSASLASASKVAHEYQTAFAGFRAMVLQAELDNGSQSRYLAKQLTSLYPAGKPGHEFAELASIFQKELEQSGSWQTACERVNALVKSKYPDLTGEEGHIGNWGYEDQGGFTVDLICPQFSPRPLR